MPFHYKVINSIGSIAKDLILGPSVVKSYKGSRKSTSYTTADATLAQGRKKRPKSYTTVDATLAKRRTRLEKYAKAKMSPIAKKKRINPRVHTLKSGTFIRQPDAKMRAFIKHQKEQDAYRK